MDPLPQTSYIPKRSFIPPPPRASRPVGIIALLVGLVFLASLGLFGGAYVYRERMKTTLAGLEDSLNKARQAFDPNLLHDITKLDSRITVSRGLLDQHLTLLPLLDLLNTQTLSSVRFKTFAFNVNPVNGRIDLKMSGEALNYEAVALQSDAFATAKKFSSFVFTDLNLDQTGKVVFNFSAVLDPLLLSYRDALASVHTSTP